MTTLFNLIKFGDFPLFIVGTYNLWYRIKPVYDIGLKGHEGLYTVIWMARKCCISMMMINLEIRHMLVKIKTVELC